MTLAPRGGVAGVAQALLDALPQTQCQRCAYPDCASYAQAIASGVADINQCPPGGQEGVIRLAQVLGRDPKPLNVEHGSEGPMTVAVIDEAWCIGCTLCIQACPVDAIVGASKQMHVVLPDWCTGCDLCVAPCPVDCIDMIPVTQTTGWQAWTQEQADTAKQRYESRQLRLVREEADNTKRLAAKAKK